ncbi:MAG: hypothetical protein OXP08_02400, partial [bacterium]|nr:hypothetical protein [bacterium]
PAGSIPVHLRCPPIGRSPSGSGRRRAVAAGWHGIPVHLRRLRLEIAVVYFAAMKKFFLFVLVAVLVAWVAKKVREV